MRTMLRLIFLSAAVMGEDGKLRLLTPSEWQAALTAGEGQETSKARVDWMLTGADGFAASGYDLVSFFKGTRPLEGKAEIVHAYRDVKFRFASLANRAAFVREPEAYLPQYGGFCAYSVAKGHPVPGSPRAWRLVSGKLYFLEGRAIMMTWERDQPLLEAAAQAQWPRLHR